MTEKTALRGSESVEIQLLHVHRAYLSLGRASQLLSGPLLARVKKHKNGVARIRSELIKALEAG